jgi:hypothetical protein
MNQVNIVVVATVDSPAKTIMDKIELGVGM